MADIGTDHALLPIYLVENGAPSALASDINEGPCERARVNVAAHGLADKIIVACRPGLDGIEAFAPDNIIIAGMGGEMIASILDASPYPRTSKCLLVLQPMSMQAVLRRYLADGYQILDELVVREHNKHYQIIAARFDGIRRTYTEAELRLGALNLARVRTAPTEADRSWLNFVRNGTQTRIRGRASAGLDSHEQQMDLEVLKTIEELQV